MDTSDLPHLKERVADQVRELRGKSSEMLGSIRGHGGAVLRETGAFARDNLSSLLVLGAAAVLIGVFNLVYLRNSSGESARDRADSGTAA